jgi:hypothetical protein
MRRGTPPVRLGLVLAAAVLVFVTHMMVAEEVPGDSWQQHARSPTWALISAGAIVLILLLHRVSHGIWLLVAGGLANLTTWSSTGKIPDYLTVVVGDRWVAFNLADAAIVVGALMVIWALVVRYRSRRRGARGASRTARTTRRPGR